ncbi:MAG: hypothetical protein NZ889_01015 [Candidatus Pacearchaeota archaeon]|nr:hypothetical protein [Candidatus Pacearchaeota archaeon]
MEKAKITMVVAASKALEYKNKNPKAEAEEIFQYIMEEIKTGKFEKAAAIAAVTKALQYKEEKMNDKEILQKIMEQLDNLISNIE